MRVKFDLKSYRLSLKLTQQGLAALLGVSLGAVSRWERGGCIPASLHTTILMHKRVVSYVEAQKTK